MTPHFLKRLPLETRAVLRIAMRIIAYWDDDLFAHSEQVARELLRLAPALSQSSSKASAEPCPEPSRRESQSGRRNVEGEAEGHEEEWYWAGLLHDLGKVGLPTEVLHKRGALTSQEKRVIEQHPLRGAAFLKKIGAPKVVVQGAKFHHERWDGTGYPLRFRGRQIPLIARVLAIADVYTALTSSCPYREGYTPAQARLEIERNAGTQFDPQIVKQFFERRKDEGIKRKAQE